MRILKYQSHYRIKNIAVKYQMKGVLNFESFLVIFENKIPVQGRFTFGPSF